MPRTSIKVHSDLYFFGDNYALKEAQAIFGRKGLVLLNGDKVLPFPPDVAINSTSVLGIAEEVARAYGAIPAMKDKTFIVYKEKLVINDTDFYLNTESDALSAIDKFNSTKKCNCATQAAMVVMQGKRILCIAQGVCDGRLSSKPYGSKKYKPIDRIFIPTFCRKTYAEQGLMNKNIRSHTANAARGILEQLKELFKL